MWKPNTDLIFVGYQARGTLGRLLVDGVKKVKLFGEEISVKAKINTINGFSAHADQDDLLKWSEDVYKRQIKGSDPGGWIWNPFITGNQVSAERNATDCR